MKEYWKAVFQHEAELPNGRIIRAKVYIDMDDDMVNIEERGILKLMSCYNGLSDNLEDVTPTADDLREFLDTVTRTTPDDMDWEHVEW